MTDWERMGFFKGFIPTKDKKPLKPYKDKPDNLLSLDEARSMGTDFAGVLKDNAVMLDADGEPHSENLLKVIQGENLSCLVTGREGGRGNHALFFDQQGLVSGCFTGVMLACGILVDIKIGSRNGYDSLKHEGVEREPFYDAASYGQLPKYLTPLKYMDKNSRVEFWNLEEGAGRNQALFNYILALTRNGFTDDEAREAIGIMNDYILKDPVSENELQTILRDDAFKKQLFFKGSTFLFDQFAEYLMHKHHIVRLDGKLLMYINDTYEGEQEDIERAMLNQISGLTRARRSEVLEYLRLKCPQAEHGSHRLIQFRNGIYNLDNNQLLPCSPDYIITNKIDWDYNPNAYHELAEATIRRIACDDQETIALLEEIIGACFYRSNKLAGGKAFILIGEQNNGKSTFIEVIKNLLGEKNKSSLDLKNINNRFATATLHKKLANIGDDISDEFVSDPALFKKIVTGNMIQAEEKGMPHFDFTPYCKLIFSANRVPKIKDRTGAVKRRLIIIPFDAWFDPKDETYDPEIEYKLMRQGSMEYFIKVGIEGLKRVLENKCFTKSQKAQKALDEYDLSNDPVLAFIEDCKDDELGIVNEALNDVYDRYQGFCIRNGSSYPLGKDEFSKQIQRRLKLTTIRKRIPGKGQVRIFVEA